MAFLRPAPFSLPSVFLGAATPGALPFSFQGPSAAAAPPSAAPSLTGKRHLEGVDEVGAAVVAKKRTDGGAVFATQRVGEADSAFGGGPPPARPPAPPPINAPAPSPPAGAAREAARGAAVPFRSSPAFACHLVTGRASGSPCAVCGEGYCPRSPCIAVGRAAVPSGTSDDCSMAQDGVAASPSSGSAADSDDTGGSGAPSAPRVQLYGPAAGLLESFPWRTVLPAMPLAYPASSATAGARHWQTYAIIPYQPPNAAMAAVAAPAAASGVRSSAASFAGAQAGSGSSMTDDDL